MSLKLIATDMDGTLLTDNDKTFDREFFGELLDRMDRLGVKFVVASGNQFKKLQEYMQGFHHRGILYIAENGAYIANDEREILVSGFSQHTVEQVVKVLDKFPRIGFVISGQKGAYMLRNRAEPISRIIREHMEFLGADVTPEINYLDFINRFYPGTKTIDSLEEMGDDTVVKFALQTHRRDIENIYQELLELLPSKVVPVTSGFGAIDLVSRGVNKGSALKWVGEKLDIDAEDMIAFGDNSNDLEMLQFVGEGVAVSNAAPQVRSAADIVIGDNNAGSVLNYIETKLVQLEEAQN